MKRILKRYLALLLVALLVITGTPMASFAAETPSITNLVGTATGATSGEFTWDYNLPDDYYFDSVSATINGDPVSIDLSTGKNTLSGLEPKTDYTLNIVANFYSTDELEFTVKKIETTSYKPVIFKETIYVATKREQEAGSKMEYYKEKNDDLKFDSLKSLIEYLYAETGYELITTNLPTLEHNAGWREHVVSDIEFRRLDEIITTTYKVDELAFDTFDEARTYIKNNLTNLGYNIVNEEDFGSNDELTITGSKKSYFKVEDSNSFSTESIPQFNLNIVIVGVGEVEPGNGSYNEGTEVTLSEKASEGWVFDGWSNNVNGSKIIMNSDQTVTATFIETDDDIQMFTLTVDKDGQGTVAPGSRSYTSGTEVDLSATPDPGWAFIGWSENVTDSKVTMDSDKTVTATFKKVYNLIVSTDGEGEVTPGNDSYIDGTEVELTAIPASGWAFIGWSENVTDSKVTMDSDKTVTATFKKVYNLTVITDGEGEVTPENDSYIDGTEVELTAKADPEWTFVGWSENVVESKIIMDSDKTVTAKFTKKVVENPPTEEKELFQLTMIKIGEGEITPASSSYEAGTEVILSEKASEGWVFAGWSENVVESTITMDSDKTVTAKFTKKVEENPPTEEDEVFTLVVEKEGQGTVTPASGTYDDGTTVTITATPASGWTFVDWSGDANGSTNPLNVTMDGNKNITAKFSRVQVPTVDNNDDDDEEIVELPERLIPAPSPQVNEPLTIVDLGEEEELPGGPAIVEEKEKEPKEEK
ncbi:MAG: InlB B-repeat-containing protein, partial [Bacillota bacterium]|nr:InlB B-repeat-containing protein [Bacillota bacterium]